MSKASPIVPLLWLFISLLDGQVHPLNAQSITPEPDSAGTIVTIDGEQYNISGGSLSGDGNNLFHSFQEFGLDANQIANFLSTPQIQNILGRVVGGEASIINGLIQVTGGNSNLYLINPSGIIFGESASLNVPGSFTATTANGIGFDNGWFNAGGDSNYEVLTGFPNQFAFTMNQPGSLVNLGDLTVSVGQSLTLLGGTVVNNGSLSAPGGNIIVTAVPGENLVRISQPGMLLSLEIAATLEGDLPTDAGISSLKLAELLTGKGESEGVTVDEENQVRLAGSDVVIPQEAGTTIIGGEVDVSDAQQGGNVYLLGEQVGVIDAEINANGGNGGGTVLIGGGYLGLGTVPNALRTFVSSDAVIQADGLNQGDGGRVIAWADEINRFWGNVSATGGINGGNGGFVEISGKDSLIFRGGVDVGATSGNLGQILFDPKNITISDGGGTNNLDGNNEFGENPTGDATFDANQINNLTGDVTLQANNDITVSEDITFNSDNSLTLQAGRSITINNVISLNGGNFSATINDENADLNQRDTGEAVFQMNSGSQIFTNGGNITIEPGNLGGSQIGKVYLDGATLNAGGGNIAITGNASNGTGIFLNSTAVQSTGRGTITFTGTGGTGTTQNFGISMNLGKVSSTNGDIYFTGTGGGDSTGNSNDNHGIWLTNLGVVESTGEGTITFTGTGGTGKNENDGIALLSGFSVTTETGNITFEGTGRGNNTGLVNDGIVIYFNAQVITKSGDITFEGTGGTGTNGNHGILVWGKVSSTDGDISLTGTGGGNGTGSSNRGISLIRGSRVESTGEGYITLEGKGGMGTIDNQGISIKDSSNISSTDGDISLKTDEINLLDTSTIQGKGILSLQPIDPSFDMAIGGMSSGDIKTLDLSNTELRQLQGEFSTITIGRPDGTGTVTLKDGVNINAPVNIAGGSTLVGQNQDTTWNITDTNQGTLNNSTFVNGLSFSNIENLSSGTANDTFIFSDGATLTGTINDSGGTSILDYSNTSTPLNVNITGIDQFTINNTLRVNQVSNIVGSRADDTILFSNGARFSGNLDGGAGNLSLRGDEIDVTGTISGSGTLLIEPETASQGIQIGGSNSTTSLDLTATKLSQIQPGFSAITIGRTDGSGVITLGGNTEFNRPVTLQSLGEGGTIDTSGGTLTNTNGTVTLDANQAITTANITAPGQQISLTSKNGSIDTSVGTLNGSNVTLNANQDITTADITASEQINLTSDNGVINTSAATLNGSNVTLNANQAITTADITASDSINLSSNDGEINTSVGTLNGSNVTLNANQAVTTGNITASDSINLTSDNGEINTSAATLNGSNVTLNANQDITTADITASDSINLSSNNGDINTSVGTLDGNSITLNANQAITTADITASDVINLTSDNSDINTSAGTLDTSSTTGNGGAITLKSPNGTITTSDINTNGATDGGDITIEAQIQITTGVINTRGNTGKGGNVTLDPEGDIQVASINAEGGTTGGDVDITTERYFRATDRFSAANGTQASISTIGGVEGGDIIIRHGGFRNNTPFDIGNAITNGTAGAITSGEFTLAPFQSFPFSHIEGNIQIISGFNSLSSDIIQSLSAGNNTSINDGTALDALHIGDTSTASLKIIGAVDGSVIDNATSNTSGSDSGNTSGNASDNANSNATNTASASNSTTRYIESLEQLRLKEFADYFGQDFSQYSVSLNSIQDILRQIQQQTGNRSAVIYGVTQPDKLTLVLFTADTEPITVNVLVPHEELQAATQKLRVSLTDSFRRQGTGYLQPAQNLYNWLIKPIASELADANIDTLLFSLDGGLRTVPLAALHDGENFLIETYSLSLIPTFSLMNTDYQPIPEAQILAMGASEFQELSPLPAVPVELSTITRQLGEGKVFLNQEFTQQNLIQQRQVTPYQIIHLGTHGNFKEGDASHSYVQLWDEQLDLTEMRQLNWDNPPVELLVLSACRTAIGSQEAELGFAGLAVASGAKTALGSIWQVSDGGTLALMTEFYTHLGERKIKAEALRQAQLSMLHGDVVIENGQLRGEGLPDNIMLPPELAETLDNVDLSNPYYWSAFTLIGSPW